MIKPFKNMSEQINDNYNLIILGSEWELYRNAYKDIVLGNVKYIPGYEPIGWLSKKIYALHFLPKLNNIIPLPFKNLWNTIYFDKVDRNGRILFLIFQNWLRVDETTGTIAYIRNHFKNCKIVLFLQDIESSLINPFTLKKIDLLSYKSQCDLIISFDKKEAKKYNFLYHPTVFSRRHISDSKKTSSDVFFIGKHKGRLNLLIDVYDKLTSLGLNCLFIIQDVPHNQRFQRSGIRYIDASISYYDVLEYIYQTHCILEVLQPGAVGYTYRVWEAISYNKRLLTNNLSLRESSYYDDKYVSIFSDASDIDLNFFKDISNPPFEINPNEGKISPKMLINFIENKLQISIIIEK